MKTVAVLASGPSITDSVVEYMHQARQDGRLSAVVAVSDTALLKAPWADALASHDTAWWHAHPEAFDFAGRRFGARWHARFEQYDIRKLGVAGGMNSGLFAMYIARDVFAADRIILSGFDMHRRDGQHFFGEHKALFNKQPLRNTNEKQFSIHIKQFEKFSGCEVFNTSMGSDLKKFPIVPLHDIL